MAPMVSAVPYNVSALQPEHDRVTTSMGHVTVSTAGLEKYAMYKVSQVMFFFILAFNYY